MKIGKIFIIGGSGQKSPLSVGLFDFNYLVLNILKEADIYFFFKVLAKFGDNKYNKDIKSKILHCGKTHGHIPNVYLVRA